MLNRLLDLKFENTEIVSATYENNGSFLEAENLPNFYRVVFKNSFSENSLIFSEIWLPDDWNGIFVGLGNGGMAGVIHHNNLASVLKKRYAVAQTDMGTSGGRNRGINNPELWKDFGWRATHYMTKVSKQIIKAHYGKEAEFSYFVGGSTGGQQALMLAQRYPDDYNGIISGVPANNRVFLHTYFLWNHNHLRTECGKTMFCDEEISKITECATQFFQNLGDGEKGDDFVSFPYHNENTINDFLDFLKNHISLNSAQINSLKAIYNGPINPKTNKQIYNGMPIGSEIMGCGIKDCQWEESPHFYPFIWVFGENYDGYSFDFDEDLKKVSDLLSNDLNANNADLSVFKSKGGKIISYSGSADPCVPMYDALKYYERVLEKQGGYDKTSSFFRYFLSPGKDHGAGGLGANALWGETTNDTDLLDVIRLWCEKDKAPEFLTAVRIEDNDIKFTRKIYPYCSLKNPKRKFMPTCDESYLDC